MNLHEQQTTVVSQNWLASRGYRGGGSSPKRARARAFRKHGIEPKTHNCPIWLDHDDHWVCAFREESLHEPQPTTVALEKFVADPILFPNFEESETESSRRQVGVYDTLFPGLGEGLDGVEGVDGVICEISRVHSAMRD